jgi:maltose O-acetyltransferase
MPDKHDIKRMVREFIASDEHVLVIPYNGATEDASRHWHEFLESSPWTLFKKALLMAVTSRMYSGRLKNMLLRWSGVKIGKHVFIASTVELDIQFPELITIEDGAILGMHSHLSTHEVTHTHIRLGKVHIGRNALIGSQATVRSGVSVGENAVVAMRAFVTQNVAPCTLVTGEPVRKIQSLESAL